MARLASPLLASVLIVMRISSSVIATSASATDAEAVETTSPTRKRIEAILEAKLDQHPELFPGADTAAPTASLAHENVRGAEYFRATTQTATPSIPEGDDDPCSSNPPSMH